MNFLSKNRNQKKKKKEIEKQKNKKKKKNGTVCSSITVFQITKFEIREELNKQNCFPSYPVDCVNCFS